MSKRQSRQTRRHISERFWCGTPPGECSENRRRVWRVWQKALQVCGATGGVGLQHSYGLSVNAEEDRRRASDVGLLVRI